MFIRFAAGKFLSDAVIQKIRQGIRTTDYKNG